MSNQQADALRLAWQNHIGEEPSESVLARAIEDAVTALDALQARTTALEGKHG